MKQLEKNERYCKETLRRYNFRKPRRQASSSEQVGPIFISKFEENQQKVNLQQQQQLPLHQEEYIEEQIPKGVHIPNKKCTKRTSWQAMVVNLHGKKMHIHQDDEIRYVFTPTEHNYNNNLKNIFPWTSSREE